MKDFHWRDIAVCFDGKQLTLECAEVRRILKFSDGMPYTSGYSWGEREYRRKIGTQPDFSAIGIKIPDSENIAPAPDFSVRRRAADCLFAEHAEVELKIHDPIRETEYLRRYLLFPGFPGIAAECEIRAGVLPDFYWLHRRTILNSSETCRSVADALLLPREKCSFEAVEFFGRTDYINDLVCTKKVNGHTAKGNLLFCDFKAGDGVLLLQEAPPTGERLDFEPYDFAFEKHTVFSCGWGIEPEAFRPGKILRSCRHWQIFYSSPEERARILNDYWRLRCRFASGDFDRITVNPWGYGNFPQLVSVDFLKHEIESAPENGGEVYQIDDGWQHGNGLSELIVKNHIAGPAYWSISEKLGGSFSDLKKTADSSKIQLGLWFAPSFNMEYRDWKAALNIILGMYRNYGICRFKIDAVLLRSHEAVENLRKLLTAARKLTDGKIRFNLDITSGQRAGLWMFSEFGDIFLENRYLFLPGGANCYNPEILLRTLWELSRFVPLWRLQVDIPDPETRSNDNKKAFPWFSEYSCDYLAALALFAQPLLWLAPSLASEKTRDAYAAILKIRKERRAEWFSGNLLPFGAHPDGAGISGFQIEYPNKTERETLLLFRERRAEQGTLVLNNSGWTVLAGDGTVSGNTVSFSRKPGFLLLERNVESDNNHSSR